MFTFSVNKNNIHTDTHTHIYESKWRKSDNIEKKIYNKVIQAEEIYWKIKGDTIAFQF